MERDPHRDLGHRQARRSRGDRLAFERDRAHDLALTGAEPVDEPLRVAQRMRILRLRRGQELLEILERLGPLPSASAQGVDDLVPGYGVGPGRKRLRGVPGMPLEVDRQQGLLHCILNISVARPGARKRGARHRAHRATDILQQSPVSTLIARDRGPHHLRPRIGRGTFGGLPIHTGFVSFRMPLQVQGNISARGANDGAAPM